MLVPSIVLYGYSDDVAVVVTWIAIGSESFDQAWCDSTLSRRRRERTAPAG